MSFLSSPSTPSRTLALNTSQALLHYLAAQEVEQHDGSTLPLVAGILGIFGPGNVAGMGRALESDELPFVQGHSEAGIGHTAIAFAKANRARRVMAVTTSMGPGSTNLATPCALAHVNRLPVLFLTADTFSCRTPDPVLQQLENPGRPLHSVNDSLEPLSRYFDRIIRPDQLLHSLPQAVRTLLDPVERGPVTLALPQDVQLEIGEFPEEFFQRRVHYLPRPRPDAREVERVGAWMRRVRRPLIIAGGGIHLSGAEEVLRRFAEKYEIPVAETAAGKGSLPFNHPLHVGAIGVAGSEAANGLAAVADGVIAIGTRLTDSITVSKSLFHSGGTQVLQINVSRSDGLKGELSLIGDARVALEELMEAVDRGEIREDYQTLHSELMGESELYYQTYTASTEEGPLTDAQVVRLVNEMAEPNSVVVGAAGGLSGEIQKLWRVSPGSEVHLDGGYACPGYEIAAGLGIKLAQPTREVYVLVGDGSYLSNHSELLTAVRMGVKLNIILVDNGGAGSLHRLQQGCGGAPYGNLHGSRPDFVRNATSYGCSASLAEDLDQLKARLEANRKRTGVCVTVVRTDPEVSSLS